MSKTELNKKSEIEKYVSNKKFLSVNVGDQILNQKKCLWKFCRFQFCNYFHGTIKFSQS